MKHPDLSIRRQCHLLSLNRSSLYYSRKPENRENLWIMEVIDKLYLENPTYGVRRMTKALERQGYHVNTKRVRRLMRMMGIEAIYRKPNTSRRNPGHKTYPYLLKGLSINRPNQVWAADITYLPMERGFTYLVAIMDWHSRFVLSHRISTSLDVSFCMEALQEALERYGPPEIFNTDQGSQFTSQEWVGCLTENNIRISMDGQGRFLDNIFVERLWRTVKYEDVHLKRYESVREMKTGISAYFTHYNTRRLHQSLDYQTPQEVYNGTPPPTKTCSKPQGFQTGFCPQDYDELKNTDRSVA